MGKELNSAYYDNVYKVSKEYKKDYRQSVYFPLWQELETLLEKDVPVIDIGCGVGQCAKFLIEKKYLYCGIDFSKEAICIAQIENPTGGFLCGDLFTFDYNNVLKKDEKVQFLISETLEHIENDILLLNKLKSERPKSNIVISVPTFDSAGHVRHFKNPAEAWERYSKTMYIENLFTSPIFIFFTYCVFVAMFKPHC